MILELMTQAHYQMAWAFALCFVLFETRSIRIKMSTTMISFATFIASIVNLYSEQSIVLYFILIPLTFLVFKTMTKDVENG